MSKVEWTNKTWNPTSGCDKISLGCKNCYADRMAKRLKAMGKKKYVNGFDLTLHPDTLDIPLKWKKPSMIFVDSMSDLFHTDVPLEFIKDVFTVIREVNWHQYQILTKRSERLLDDGHKLDWPDNLWMGVSIENAECFHRAEHLRKIGAKIKFLSLEPLLGPLDGLYLDGIDWVIVGGESGPRARPMEKEWVIDIRDKCQKSNTPFFFKQWGGTNKKKAGRMLDGRLWDEMPRNILFNRAYEGERAKIALQRELNYVQFS